MNLLIGSNGIALANLLVSICVFSLLLLPFNSSRDNFCANFCRGFSIFKYLIKGPVNGIVLAILSFALENCPILFLPFAMSPSMSFFIWAVCDSTAEIILVNLSSSLFDFSKSFRCFSNSCPSKRYLLYCSSVKFTLCSIERFLSSKPSTINSSN